MLKIRPITLKEANAYVAQRHRHNLPTNGHKWSLACYDGDRLCGVAIAGQPVARKLDAADAIEELVAKVPKWISVEERLPHYLDHVLCINKFGIQMVGHLTDYKEGGFRCESGMDSCDYITHWMPLPKAPEPLKED